MAYPAVLTQDANDTWIVSFPDLPEALTVIGSLDELQKRGSDCLALALAFYLDAEQPIPTPRPAAAGERVVSLSMRDAGKLAIYQGMRARGWSRHELARQLRKDEKQVRRLLDLTHASTFGQVEEALALLGRTPLVSFSGLASA